MAVAGGGVVEGAGAAGADGGRHGAAHVQQRRRHHHRSQCCYIRVFCLFSSPVILRGGRKQQKAGAGAGELLGEQAHAAAREDAVLLCIETIRM